MLRGELPLLDLYKLVSPHWWLKPCFVCFLEKGKLAPKLSMVAEFAFFCSLLAVVHLGFNL